MLDFRLEAARRADLERLEVDWREAWAGPDPLHGEIVAWPASAAKRSGLPLREAEALVSVVTPLEPLRAGPSHRSEMISEIRGGEWLTRILSHEGWWLVAGEDDYVGWLHAWVGHEQSATKRQDQLSRRIGRYGRPLGTLWLSDHYAATPLVLGAPLLRADGPLTARGEWVLVATPNGEEGWLPRAEVQREGVLMDPRPVLDAARALLGTPYRWGGRSPFGFDCSGFVQYTWMLAGVAIPRDSSQQQWVGEGVDFEHRNAWQAGDLLVFGEPADHVGIYDGRGGMIHCSGTVRREELSGIPQRMERLSAVRRVGSAQAFTEPTLWRTPPRRNASP